jgi:Asp/Glu/hydantoin racemase
MRIWHQSMSDLDALPEYRALLQRHLHRVVDPDTVVDLHGLQAGAFGSLAPADVVPYPVAFHRILGQVLLLYERAEAEGYDAIVIAGWSEAFLREARSLVDIPVVSMPESNLLAACSVGKLAGLVTISPLIARHIRTLVSAHRFEQRVTAVVSLEPHVNEHDLAKAMSEPEPLLDAFSRAARQQINAGADVVIPAEGFLSELLVDRGVDEIDGVSVMDSVGVALLNAQMMVRLKARTGLHAGRRWEYRKLPPGERDA